MKLEGGKVFVKDVILCGENSFEKGILKVNIQGLTEHLLEDHRIGKVKVDLAKPGESVRIIPVKDVIEPRVKVSGEAKEFPGVTSTMATAGKGRSHVLKNAAVVTTGSIVGFQEGVLDMSGPGAAYSPFSKTLNIVVELEPKEGITQHEHEEAARLAGLKAAAYIGECAREVEPDEIETFEMNNNAMEILKYPDLPKVVYMEMLITQGLLHDTYIYGLDAKQTLPTLLHPNEVLDGAVVSGNCVAACDKITTYQHLNNSVVKELYERHGKDLVFLGVVLTNENITLQGKLRSCNMATNIAKHLGADGVVISEEGYGNPDSDLMMNCRLLEEDGVKTVLITDECAGRDGMSQSLTDATPHAKAIVSTGNVSHLVSLPPMEKIIGNEMAIEQLAGGYSGSLLADGSLECELNAILGCTSEIGYHNVTTKEY